MRIDLWSDILCPFCYLAKQEFAKALAQFEHADEVEMHWHAFELNPQAELEPFGLSGHLAEIYDRPMDEIIEQMQLIESRAAELGIEFNWADAKVTNSFDAHRLAKYAESKGCGEQVMEALMRGFFTEGRVISDAEFLLEVSTGAGLDADETTAMLVNGDFGQEVRDDENAAAEMGLAGVPQFVFAERWAVSGAQQAKDFKMILDEVWEQLHQPRYIKLSPVIKPGQAGGGCGCGGCGCGAH